MRKLTGLSDKTNALAGRRLGIQLVARDLAQLINGAQANNGQAPADPLGVGAAEVQGGGDADGDGNAGPLPDGIADAPSQSEVIPLGEVRQLQEGLVDRIPRCVRVAQSCKQTSSKQQKVIGKTPQTCLP